LHKSFSVAVSERMAGNYYLQIGRKFQIHGRIFPVLVQSTYSTIILTKATHVIVGSILYEYNTVYIYIIRTRYTYTIQMVIHQHGTIYQLLLHTKSNLSIIGCRVDLYKNGNYRGGHCCSLVTPPQNQSAKYVVLLNSQN
jgi:hypothetical protein